MHNKNKGRNDNTFDSIVESVNQSKVIVSRIRDNDDVKSLSIDCDRTDFAKIKNYLLHHIGMEYSYGKMVKKSKVKVNNDNMAKLIMKEKKMVNKISWS